MSASAWNPSNPGVVLSNLNRISTTFVAGAGQTSFPLATPYTVGAQNLEVFKDGQKLVPADVTEVSGGASFELAACVGGEIIESVVYPGTSQSFVALAAQANSYAAAAAISAGNAANSAALAATFATGWQTANNTWSGANDFQSSIRVKDAGFSIVDELDNSKIVIFQVAGVSPGTTRTITMPDADVILGSGGPSASSNFFANQFYPTF